MSQIIQLRKHFVWSVVGILFTTAVFSQETAKIRTFSGAITTTNNGISTFPNLSLGKPAAIFDFSVGSKRWSFDPQLRFSMQGKPWTFIFWGRYKVVNDKKFKFTIGAHPAFSFKEENVLALNGDSKTVMNVYRYAAAEFVPNVILSKNFSVGLYYLYSHGVDPGTTTNSHFIKLNTAISNIKLSESSFLKWQPQAYYLKMDSREGYYASSVLTLTTKNCPFAVSSIMNKIIKSDIPGDDFVWNVSLVYNY
jgi:hypothetical protein